ncbi:ATPase [Paraburkholderia acidicola]|uniref:ATPase n=1 Tax=Paraburkholderia acidicola TaxID=1912599 RepID=A0A2A4EVM1_9BURK|nr:SRPBCC domain-containing protein [Paraburkholderia acidicola]PCE24129.1 ATPase [Paraburkholderia acidicola]
MSSRVLVSLRVAVSAQHAFDVFTRDIAAWWRPNGLFQFTPQGAGVLSLEHSDGGGGGRLIETQPDGAVFEVGRITAWEPGVRVAFDWRQASFAADQLTHVEVRFEAVEGETAETRVTVEHCGWDSVPQEHVARHHFPDRVYLQRHAEWWQALLASYHARFPGADQ